MTDRPILSQEPLDANEGIVPTTILRIGTPPLKSWGARIHHQQASSDAMSKTSDLAKEGAIPPSSLRIAMPPVKPAATSTSSTRK